VLRYALHLTERFAEAAGSLFLSYMLASPIVLFFLKGERIWRLVVIVLGLLPKPSFQTPISGTLAFRSSAWCFCHFKTTSPSALY
jgi:hypothetical protein